MRFDDFKHAQRERLIFLDQCFAWRGMANRRDLINRFSVSTAQAALDFKLYIERANETPPIYDAVRKTYLAAPNHKSLAPIELDQGWERIVENGAGDRFDALPKLNRRCEPSIVARLYQAMDNGNAIHIKYTSMTTGSNSGQWIAPSCFVSDGERIHVRAYSFKHDSYRDYVPVRISEKSSFETKELRSSLPRDDDWNTIAKIYLRPKSSLSPEQAKAVRREFGFVDETLCIQIRKALEFYTERRWGLRQPNARLERARTEYVPITDECESD